MVQDQTVSPPASQMFQQQQGYISVKQILEYRAQEQPEETRSPVSEIKMHLGFTGAEFTDADGGLVHKNFAILMVDPASFFCSALVGW